MRATMFIGVIGMIFLVASLLWMGAARPKKKWKTLGGILLFYIVILVSMNYIMFEVNAVDDPIMLPIMRTVGYGVFGTLAATLFSLVPLAILAIIRWFVERRAKSVDAATGESRRKWLTAGAIAIPTVALGTASSLAYTGDKNLWVHEITLRFPKLPEALKGYKFGQISDSHLGPYFSMEDLHEAVSAIQKRGAKRLFVTGDFIDDIPLVDMSMRYMKEINDVFPDGIQYIYGNHEYYRDLETVEEGLAHSGMDILRNSHMKIFEGKEPVYLVGVDYPFNRSRMKEDMEEMLTEAMVGIPEGAFVILLAHHPDFIGEAFKRNIPLTLAGHSHGGQITIGNKPVVPMQFEYWKGLYKAEGKVAYGYVSNGTGAWWPIRYDCPREVTIFTLEEGADENEYNMYK